MQKSEVKDLTVGSPMKLILSFAVPMLPVRNALMVLKKRLNGAEAMN